MLKIGTLDTKLIFFPCRSDIIWRRGGGGGGGGGKGREETGRGREEGLLDDPKTRLGIRQILIGKQRSFF